MTSKTQPVTRSLRLGHWQLRADSDSDWDRDRDRPTHGPSQPQADSDLAGGEALPVSFKFIWNLALYDIIYDDIIR